MSKDKPEVGDVFLDNQVGEGLIITFTKYDLFWGLWSTGQSFSCWQKKDFKSKQYLGKSKANIDDLFKTENEE